MAKAYRWAYMSNPNYNPPSDDCPQCEEPSKVYHIGSRTEQGVVITTWKCEHQHEWCTLEDRRENTGPKQ